MVDVLQCAEKSMKQESKSLFSVSEENRLIQIMLKEFSQEKFSDIAEIITEDDFESERCGLAFKVIKQLVNENVTDKNVTVDYYTVGKVLNEIPRFGQLESNGINYLCKLASGDDLGTWDWIVNAKQIRRCSLRRKYRDILVRAIARNENPQGETVTASVNSLLSDLEPLQERLFASTQGPQNLNRAYVERMQEHRDRQEKPEEHQGEIIPTGYPAIDQLLAGGFRKGNLIVIGARPGTGKTTLGLNIAERLIFNSTITEPVLFFSLEMPFHEITDRFIASVAGIDHAAILNASMTAEDYISWKNGFDRLKDRNVIFVDDRSNLKPVEIKARASRFKQQRGLSLIVVDYLQYIQNPGYKNKTEELEKISNELKALAKDLDVPVIALAQLNRNSENRGDKTPGMADLRGSGAIEQDADVAMFIYRKNPQEQQTEILISKNRHGQTGSVFLTFNGQYARFDD